MELKTGYKQTEVGIVPSNWTIDRIFNLARITTGAKNTQDKVDDGLYPFFVRSQIVERIDSHSFDGEAVLTAGDGVGTGKVFHYINGKFDFHQRVYKISDFDQKRLDGYFFFLYFSNHFLQRIMSMTAKSSVDSVRMEMIANMNIPLPTIAEQMAIAEALSDADTLIASLDKLITKKKDIKQGAMQLLLTGKKRLPGFSGEWEIKTLGDLFSISGGLSASRDKLSDDGYCYLHYGDIHGSNKSYIDVEEEYSKIPKLKVNIKSVTPKSLLNDGDVVFVDASEDDEGASRHVVIINPQGIPFISGLHTIVIKSIDDSVVNSYKQFCFQTHNIKKQFKFYAVGTKVTGISKTNIAHIQLLLPPTKEEQHAIAQVLTDMDAEIEGLEGELAKYKLIKRGMMQELLTGKKRLI